MTVSANNASARAAGQTGSDAASGKRLFASEALRRADMLRLGGWGVAAVVAVAGAVLTANAMGDLRRATDTAQVRIRSLQEIAEDRQREAGRVRAAIDILNADRDRLYARLTIAEKTLFDIKDEVAKQIAALPQAPASTVAMPAAPANTVQAVATMAAKTDAKRTDASGTDAKESAKDGGKNAATGIAKDTAMDAPETTASIAVGEFPRRPPGLPLPVRRPADATTVAVAAPKLDAAGATAPTAFAIDLGSSRSIAAMRTLWRTLTRRHGTELAHLQPLLVVTERRDKPGMDLRLLAGPFADRDLASAMCASLAKAGHAGCQPAPFDGQRLEPAKARHPVAADKAENPAQDQTPVAVAKPERPDPPQSVAEPQASPKLQTRVQNEPARTASDSLPNPLEKLFGIGR